MRENPATWFIARTIAEKTDGKPWGKISQKKRIRWYEVASDLVIAMYHAGFVIPQPKDPDAVWSALRDSA